MLENNKINKLDMKSKDMIATNIDYIGKKFPNVVVEGKIDFNALKQELSNDLIDDKKEKYQLMWSGKKESIIEANTPINKSLRPIKEKSVNFDSTKNIYIEGDNLEVLKILMVQIPEKITDKKYLKYLKEEKISENTITGIGKERIRRAANKIKEETNADIDYGFRVYKVDSSNMKDVYYEPSKLKQEQLNMFESNIKEDRTSEDILTQVILDLGLTLDLKIEEKEILNNKVFFVAENSLLACFDEQINIDIINQICEVRPLKVVFRESSFKNDSDKINAYERIKKLSPETEINVI